MTARIAIIGIGNAFRRDDGIGPAVAAAVDAMAIPGVRVVTDAVEPTRLLDAWVGVRLAILIDAATMSPSVPGTIHRCEMEQLAGAPTVSSHGVDLATVIELGRALGRLPAEVVLFAVEVAETGYGPGLTPKVEEAIPHVVAAVMAETGCGPFAHDERAEMPWLGIAQ